MLYVILTILLIILTAKVSWRLGRKLSLTEHNNDCFECELLLRELRVKKARANQKRQIRADIARGKYNDP